MEMILDKNLKEKIIQAYRTGGFITLFYRAFRKIRKILFKFHTSYWYIRDLRKPLNNIEPSLKVDIKFNSMSDTLEWEKVNLHSGVFYAEDIKEINVAQKNKHYFVNVSHNHKIIGFLKVGLREIYFKEYMANIPIPQHIAFIYDTYIHPNYRGMGIAPYMINAAMKQLSTNGLKFMMCHIKPLNLASQSTYAKVGFEKINFIWHLRLFGLRIFNLPPQKLIQRYS
jgi:ribosomal protein S18 acetylase RimI-like enzyme